ncbi:MAG: FAD-dependent oxidoreductase [Sulfurimonas sp.]|nr:FAD-dependent oxidoreductase [Sulfurimonas sp.]
MSHYDVAIIGAGIIGSSLAYELHQKGQKVLVLEKEESAAGGSGAAGAFINPKISKSGPLKELIEKAYLYSLDFYTNKFPSFTSSAPLLHIAKYEDENEKVDYFKTHTSLAIGGSTDEINSLLTSSASSFSSVYLKDNAIVEAKGICQSMLEGIDFTKTKVKEPLYKDGLWHIGAFKAKKLVLCTGGYEEVFKEPYIKLRRIYGQRCEVSSSTFMPCTVHHEVSISATKKNGRIAIGASHYLNREDIPSLEQGSLELIELAKKSVNLEDIKIHSSYCGMRSGSNDYLPILGQLISAKESLESAPEAMKGDKSAKLEMTNDLYMINGVGGYGFVLGPYLAKLMCEHLLEQKALPSEVDLKRLYYRWAKKEGKEFL